MKLSRLNGSILSLLIPLIPLLCAGCGGHDCCSATGKATARQRAVASMRITRATFAVGGFGRRIGKAARNTTAHSRVGIWLAAIPHRRDATPGADTPALDIDTGLYYTLKLNADGSGQQDLFTDATKNQTAGAFMWTAPQWTNNQTNNYPAAFHTTYQITAGEFAGEHGTMDITTQDATGMNETLRIDLTDTQGEHSITDVTITGGVVSAKAHCILPDYFAFDQTYYTDPNDVVICTTTFPDTGSEDINLYPDGTATETVYDSGGTVDATGDVQASGDDTIDYSDGSSETVNVDTDTGSSDDSSKAAGKARRVLTPKTKPRSAR